MSNPKILVLYASCGAGHYRAAQAISQYLSARNINEVALQNILDFAPLWYRKIYQDGYYYLTRRHPQIWSWLYQFTEHRNREGSFVNWWRRLEIHWFKKFFQYLEEFQPSFVISTHFLPLSLLWFSKKNFKFGVVVTDYYPHNMWVSTKVDKYFVGSPEVKETLERKGIKSNKIFITGIPIKSSGSFNWTKNQMRQKLGLKENLFTVLVLSGAGGVGDISLMIKELEKLEGQVQVFVNTGLNKPLQERLVREFSRSLIPTKIFGFCEDIYQYYYASDLVISKPGGLTVTESLVLGLPLLMIKVIPGQEEDNARFVVANKAGVMVKDIKEISDLVRKFIMSPQTLQEMKANTGKIAPQNPCEKIYQEISQE